MSNRLAPSSRSFLSISRCIQIPRLTFGCYPHLGTVRTSSPTSRLLHRTNMSSPSRPQHRLQIAETKDEIEACYDIRIEVFSVEQGFPLETEIDDYDPISTHFLLTVPISSPPDTSSSSLTPSVDPTVKSTSQKPIGTIRWTSSVGKVSRLAILKEYRKYGFGRVLMAGMNNYVKKLYEQKPEELKTLREAGSKAFVQAKLHSQVQAIPFYEKMGYQAEGEIFDEEGGPHKKMTRDIEVKSS